MSRVVEVVGAAILRDGRCLAARRGPRMSLPGKWEFPGGKVEPGEDADAALVREIAEELDVTIAVGERLGTTQLPGSAVRLSVYLATIVQGEPAAREHDAIRWCAPVELEALDWAEADVPLVSEVLARLVE